MKRFPLIVAALVSSFLLACGLYPRETKAPVYQDGDWWRVRVEVKRLAAFPRPERCDESHREYVVRIAGGEPRLFVIDGTDEKAAECPAILAQLLDMGPRKQALLQFPMKVKNRWNFSYRRAFASGRVSWIAAESHVKSLEMVKTPRGEVEAFKIERQAEGVLGETYYYSPAVKAIIRFDLKTASEHRRMIVTDYGRGV